jgi:hypothetical protein
VFAHPDYETFGLGAVLGALVDAGTAVDGLCFTRGEASTLRARPDNLDQLGHLGDIRAAELSDAARVLGLEHCELLIYPDGRLAETSVAVLAAHLLRAAQCRRADLLVAIVGGSGAGKTTLLETMAGTRRPAAAGVRIGATHGRSDVGYAPHSGLRVAAHAHVGAPGAVALR